MSKLKFWKTNPDCYFYRTGKCTLKKNKWFCCLRYCYIPRIEGIYDNQVYLTLIENRRIAFRADLAIVISILAILFELIKQK